MKRIALFPVSRQRGRGLFSAAVVFVALWIGPSGCGYRLAGTGELPPGVTSVGVRTLVNRTTVVGLENTLTNDLVFEFTRAGRVPILRPEAASAVMSGTLHSLRESALSRSGTNTAQERRVTLSVDFVAERSDGEVVWRRTVTDSETYVVEPDNFGTQANRQAALEVLSRRMAEKAYSGLMERF